MPRRGLPQEGAGEVAAVFKAHARRLRMLEMPTGEQLFRALDQVKQLILDLPGLVAAAVTSFLSTGFTTGSMHATGNVQVDGAVSAGGNLVSVGSSMIDVSAMAGLRQQVWQLYTGANLGLYGYASSSITTKTNLSEDLPFIAQDVYATIPFLYQYIGQVAVRDDLTHPNYDPAYEPPINLGLMAEYLAERNMGIFVIYQEDGITPKTIDYALFGAIANLVAVRDLDARLRAAGI